MIVELAVGGTPAHALRPINAPESGTALDLQGALRTGLPDLSPLNAGLEEVPPGWYSQAVFYSMEMDRFVDGLTPDALTRDEMEVVRGFLENRETALLEGVSQIMSDKNSAIHFVPEMTESEILREYQNDPDRRQQTPYYWGTARVPFVDLKKMVGTFNLPKDFPDQFKDLVYRALRRRHPLGKSPLYGGVRGGALGARIVMMHQAPDQFALSVREAIDEARDRIKELYPEVFVGNMSVQGQAEVPRSQLFDQIIAKLRFYSSHVSITLPDPPESPSISLAFDGMMRVPLKDVPRTLERGEVEAIDEGRKPPYLNPDQLALLAEDPATAAELVQQYLDWDRYFSERRGKYSTAARYWLRQVALLRARGEENDRARAIASFFIERLMSDRWASLNARLPLSEVIYFPDIDPELTQAIRQVMPPEMLPAPEHPERILVIDDAFISVLIEGFRSMIKKSPTRSQQQMQSMRMLGRIFKIMLEGYRGTVPLANYHTARNPRLRHAIDRVYNLDRPEGTSSKRMMDAWEHLDQRRLLLDRAVREKSDQVQPLRDQMQVALDQFKEEYRRYRLDAYEAMMLAPRDPRVEEVVKLYWVDQYAEADRSGHIASLRGHLTGERDRLIARRDQIVAGTPATVELDSAIGRLNRLIGLLNPGAFIVKRPEGDEIAPVMRHSNGLFVMGLTERNKGWSHDQTYPPGPTDEIYSAITLRSLDDAVKKYSESGGDTRRAMVGALANTNAVILQVEPRDFPTYEKHLENGLVVRMESYAPPGLPAPTSLRSPRSRNWYRWLADRDAKGSPWQEDPARTGPAERHPDLRRFRDKLSVAAIYNEVLLSPDLLPEMFAQLELATDIQKKRPDLVSRVVEIHEIVKEPESVWDLPPDALAGLEELEAGFQRMETAGDVSGLEETPLQQKIFLRLRTQSRRISERLQGHPFPIKILLGPGQMPVYRAENDGLPMNRMTLWLFSRGVENLILREAGPEFQQEFSDAVREFGANQPFTMYDGQTVLTMASTDEVRQLVEGDARLNPQQRARVILLKEFIDRSRGLNPDAVVEAAVNFLFDDNYRNLLENVNHVRTNPGKNPRLAGGKPPVRSAGEIDSQRGVEIWLVKEGNDTMVAQVSVFLKDGTRSLFVVNVAKDLTDAGRILTEVVQVLDANYERHPGYSMETFQFGEGTAFVGTREQKIPLFTGEWLEGYEESHLFAVPEDSGQPARFHVWWGQNSRLSEPLSETESDSVWSALIEAQTVLSWIEGRGKNRRAILSQPNVNAGDMPVIKPGNGWKGVLIWDRRMVPPEKFDLGQMVLEGLLKQVVDSRGGQIRRIWWGKPEKAVEAIRRGFVEAARYQAEKAGKDQRRAMRQAQASLNRIFERVYEGTLQAWANDPSLYPGWSDFTASEKQRFSEIVAQARHVVGVVIGEEEPQSLEESGLEEGYAAKSDRLERLIPEVEQLMAAETKSGLLRRTIGEIRSDSYFVEGQIAYIPVRQGALYVIGDNHGDYKSLRKAIQRSGYDPEDPDRPHLVFVGDYGDVGKKSLDVVLQVLEMKLADPERITLLAGNHDRDRPTRGSEDVQKWIAAGNEPSRWFFWELEEKIGPQRGSALFDRLTRLARSLPMLVVTANGIAVTHASPPSALDPLYKPEEGLLGIAGNQKLLDRFAFNLIRYPDAEADEQNTTFHRMHPRLEMGHWIGRQGIDTFLNSIGATVLVRGHNRTGPVLPTHQGKVLTVITTDWRSNDGGYPKQDRGVARIAKFDLAASYAQIPSEVILSVWDAAGRLPRQSPSGLEEVSERVPFELGQLAERSRSDLPLIVDLQTLPPGLLRDFIEWLNQIEADDVVVIGGMLRDTLLGYEPGDVDFAVKVELPADLQQSWQEDVRRLTPIALNEKYKLQYRADKVLYQVAKKMQISPSRLLRLRERFQEQGLEFSFSAVVAGNFLIDFGRQATFTVNQIAMDRKGRVYLPESRRGFEDLFNRLIVVPRSSGSGPIAGIGLKTALQGVRYHHQYGMTIDPATYQLFRRVAERGQSEPPSRIRRIWWTVKGTIRELGRAVAHPSLAGAHLRSARRLAARMLWDSWMHDAPGRWLEKVLESVPDPVPVLRELAELGLLDVLRISGADVDGIIDRRMGGPPASAGLEELTVEKVDQWIHLLEQGWPDQRWITLGNAGWALFLRSAPPEAMVLRADRLVSAVVSNLAPPKQSWGSFLFAEQRDVREDAQKLVNTFLRVPRFRKALAADPDRVVSHTLRNFVLRKGFLGFNAAGSIRLMVGLEPFQESLAGRIPSLVDLLEGADPVIALRAREILIDFLEQPGFRPFLADEVSTLVWFLRKGNLSAGVHSGEILKAMASIETFRPALAREAPSLRELTESEGEYLSPRAYARDILELLGPTGIWFGNGIQVLDRRPVLPSGSIRFGFSAGLEELGSLRQRMPEWLRGIISPDRLPDLVRGVHEISNASDKVAVLIHPGLFPADADPFDLEVNLVGLSGNVRASLGLREGTDLRIGLLTEENLKTYNGYRIVQVLRDPAAAHREALPLEAVPLVVAEALSVRGNTFWVDVTPYLAVSELTMPEVLSTLTDLFA